MKGLEEINEAKKTTVYVVVEDGDSVMNTAQYVLDDMKIFFNEKDAQKYADSQKYGGFSVIKEEVI
jgi:ribosome-binding ATPase YchF (GTP1/OBG family)